VNRQFLAASGVAGVFPATGVPAFQNPEPPRLPYAAIHDPRFIGAPDATFMNDEDRAIDVMTGKTAKAFPAGILSQHGLVEDQPPQGPIAIAW